MKKSIFELIQEPLSATFVITFFASFIFLYSRRKKWFTTKIKNAIMFVLLSVGIFGVLISESNAYRLLFYLISSPAIFLIIDRIFGLISFRIQGRDFLLWLSHSDDLDKKDISGIDIIFSIIILILTFLIFAIGGVLFGEKGITLN